jgi:hypothetical protein
MLSHSILTLGSEPICLCFARDRYHNRQIVVMATADCEAVPHQTEQAPNQTGDCPKGASCAKKGQRRQHKRVRRVVTLGVQLVGERDIVVTSPESGFSITYRKDGLAPMLVAIDDIGRSSEPSMEVLGTSMEGCSSESPLSRLATFLICLAESNLPACESLPARGRRACGRG